LLDVKQDLLIGCARKAPGLRRHADEFCAERSEFGNSILNGHKIRFNEEADSLKLPPQPLLSGQYLGKRCHRRRNRLSRGDRRKDALIQRIPLTQAREIRDRAVIQLTQLLQDLPNPLCKLLGRRAPCLKVQRKELEKV